MTITSGIVAAIYCPEAPVRPIDKPLTDAIVLPRRPENVRVGRKFTVDTLTALGVDADTVEAARLIVSEYGQNALRHGGEVEDDSDPGVMTFTVAVWDGWVRVTVSDPGELYEKPSDPGPDGSGEHETGYGLGLVAEYSQAHGVERVYGGKVAFADIKISGGVL